ncbi:MAG: hypothetical protein ABEK50_01210 [bacterium]
MTDSSTRPDQRGPGTSNRFVLRLLVIKVEGVLVPPPTEWNLPDTDEANPIDPDELFPDWINRTGLTEDNLRSALVELARSGKFTVDSRLRSLIDHVRNHTPVRTAFLSSGPRDWIEALETQYELENLRDLSFCYDNYTHGSRRTLLQFLMNRFIAGKGRTMLLGRTLADETLARQEKTRFRSLQPPPENARNPDNWGWSLEQLRTFIKEKQPES